MKLSKSELSFITKFDHQTVRTMSLSGLVSVALYRKGFRSVVKPQQIGLFFYFLCFTFPEYDKGKKVSEKT